APAPHMTCDVTHQCDLVTEISVDTSVSGTGFVFFTQPLTFFGAPPAGPAPSVGTISSGSVQITYPLLAAGVASGNGTIDKYSVTATPTSATGACVGAVPVTLNNTTRFASPVPGRAQSVTGTSVTFTGLNNFCDYNFTPSAEAVAADGSTHATSTTPGGPVTAHPAVAGPTGLSTAPGDGQVTFSW